MRLRFAFVAAQSVGLFLASEAFTPTSWRTSAQTRSITLLHADTFDNDDFLESLKGSNPDSGEDDDEVPSDTEGVELTDEMRKKLQAEDETFGGGSRFKDMLGRAQASAGSETPQPRSLKNPFAENPFSGIEGVDPEATPGAETPDALEGMTVEQQAQMFRAMMQGGGPSFQVPTPKPKPDRKVGRNRDADAIQNTADVYFAQLKRDSTVRGIARIQGDEEKANAVFKDEKIRELEKLISENPHLKGKRDEERKLIDAAAEEMVAFQKAMEVRPKVSTTGVSYKQKLAEKRKRASGGGGAPASTSPAPAAKVETPSPPKVEEPVPESPKVEAATPEPPAPAKFEEPAAVAPAPAAEAPPAQAPAPAAPRQSTPSVTSSSSPDEIRTAVRTLMGLILKHRGGPGFGAGGLKGEEIGKYEKLMNEVTALLKEEAQMHNTASAAVEQAASAAQQQQPATQSAPAPQVQAPPQQAQSQASSQGSEAYGLATVPTSPSSEAQIDSMLACIDGAILMYRNSPAELKESVLMTVRAALLSAVNTCNKVMGQNDGVPTTTGAGTNVDSMFACIEGAILMYRNSPPELKQGVLMTVRAALLSAVGTCNKIIAENDVQNFMDYQEATSGMDMPPHTPKPVQFYDVEQVAQEEPLVEEPAAIGTDSNSAVLENIYNKLEAAAGDGKLGLRSDLTAGEASDLADSIAEMRSILVDEMTNGIPEAPAAAASPSDSGSTASLYQKMLAKAKAERAARS